MATKRKRKPQIKIELVVWNDTHQITKIVHASHIPLTNGNVLRVGSKIWQTALVDALAEQFDVTITQSKSYL